MGEAMRPLQGVRVLSVTVYLAGPYCSMSLAALGAEVLKVEQPGRGDPSRGNGPFVGPDGANATPRTDQDISSRFLKRARGLKGVTLDLKKAEGRSMFMEMARASDVLVENLQPGSMSRMGLGYQDMAQVNPGIVYCSISGFGHTGPNALKPTHDPVVQGMSGLMDINGDADRPPTKVGFYISDLVTPLFACYSIVSALREKERTGQGQHLDVSMMDSLVSLMFMENLEESISEGIPLRAGNVGRAGPTGMYSTTDGDVMITAASDDQWRRLANALDAPELLEDPRFLSYHSRNAYIEDARHEVGKRMKVLTRQEALDRMELHEVPCGPVRPMTEVMNDPHLWQRGTLQPMLHGALDGPVEGIATGFPVVFSGGPLPELAGAPTLGMHNEEVYRDLLGLGPQDLQRLRAEGII